MGVPVEEAADVLRDASGDIDAAIEHLSARLADTIALTESRTRSPPLSVSVGETAAHPSS